MFQTTNRTDYLRHINSRKHLEHIETQHSMKYNCDACDYHTDKRSKYVRHLETAKHAINTATPERPAKVYRCTLCLREYKYKSGLMRHEKTCGGPITDHLIEVMKEATERLTEEAAERLALVAPDPAASEAVVVAAPAVPPGGTAVQNVTAHNAQINNNTTNNITNHNTVVINFLNTECADAMNINEFMEGVDITFEELKFMAANGFNKSAKQIIARRLGEIDVNKRPIHCTDKKRKTMYVRRNDIWRRDPEHMLIRGSMRHLHCKGMDAVESIQRELPEDYFLDSDHLRLRNDIILSLTSFDHTDDRTAKSYIGAVSQAAHLSKKDIMLRNL